MFCMHILLNRHGQLFGGHSRIFFLNSLAGLIFLFQGEKSPIFYRPKENIVSNSQRIVLLLLHASGGLFLKL